MRTPVIVLDNGASTIKASVLSGRSEQTRIISNAVVRSKRDKKTYFGHEIDQCCDYSSLHYRRPFEKGYLTDWDAQKAVWDGIFSKDINTSEFALLITEPPFNLPNIQDVYDQFVFEEYEFQSYFRCTSASLVPHGDLYAKPDLPPPECVLIVDSGFSFTHVVPIMNNVVIWESVRRIDVGGKLLTNHLKELVSFRQWNMMDETHIVNDVKESCCYVSNDYKKDLEICQFTPRNNSIVLEYLLPDFSINRHGRIKRPDDILSESDQVLLMNNERFAVPEIIFRPSDIGLEQSGLSETIANVIVSLPEDLRGLFWANIGLVGGNVKFHGFRERLIAELRCLAPVDCEVQVYQSSDPITQAYRAGVDFARSPAFFDHVVTRAEYLEAGSNACRRKFNDWRSAANDEQREDESQRVKDKEKRVKGKARAREAEEEPKKAARSKTRKGTTRKTDSRIPEGFPRV